ncbi:MAG: ABC transporter ATP-binding protein [Rhodocyclaceae bacterium]|nr:ABC transporter ATP-binding protein [Rhodocyclaceae bacterium]MCP5239940.1 ABC transporter ATP-binding protein [Zoogloeaceae bacterium]MCB1910766.1 ABC transporter ATP-binding protein [Rhodocyclaceae bacterium]MCP5253831.1 ABC transporter ATP-binding protein [Zoogloeaceae bacterium]MCP5293779.1 ABC transporter ATP-binding protein [Zoogloeaceae bacterium]
MIRLHNLTLGYDRHPAVHHLDLELPQGSLVAIVGPNGAGKSTLLKGIAGALQPLGGRIDLDGIGPREIAYLPQHHGLDLDFPMSVFDLVSMGLWRFTGVLGGLGKRGRAAVKDALDAVGLGAFGERPIGSLSGGQLQRVRFARLLLQDAPVMLLDEPFAAVDQRTSEDLMRIVLDWHARGRSVIVVLHDIEQVRRHFPTCLLVAREPIAFGPTSEVLTAANLARARQQAAVFDDHAAVCHQDDRPAVPA